METWETFTITLKTEESDSIGGARETDLEDLTDRFESELHRLVQKYNKNKVGLHITAITSDNQPITAQ